jgi:hypothetical protein
MWIPSHVENDGNQLVDDRTRHVALTGVVFDRPLSPVYSRVWQDLFC